MNDVMRVRSPGELVAAIPHLLGFVPEESVVCVPLGGGPVARLDHPHDEEDIGAAASVLAAPYLRDRLDVVVLCLTEDRVAAKKTSLALRRRLVGHVKVPLVLWVNNNTWTNPVTGQSGEVPDVTRKQLAAEAVFGGRRLPMGSREALAAEVRPDPVRVAAVTIHLRGAITSTRQTNEAGHLDLDLGDEGDWVRDTIGGFCRTQRPLDDQTAARLLADMAVPELRDAAWLLMNQPDATKHVALWADLTRRSPTEVRTPAASLLAFASWLDGNGARAWVALDLLPDHDQQDYPLAAMTALVLNQAIPPTLWDTHRAATKSPAPASQVALQQAYLTMRPAIEHEEQDHYLGGGPYREGPASPGR